MRGLITGGAGLLGSALIGAAPSGWELHATQRTASVLGATPHPLELSDLDGVTRLWQRLRPELVIHTAYSPAPGERDIWAATRAVVEATRAVGSELIHMSTDALLDGERAPYAEDAEAAPVHEYGEWKARAERYVRETLPRAAVIRTSLLVSFDPMDPRSRWVTDALRSGERVTLFTDELRCPIAVDDLARQIWELAGLPPTDRAGVWNLAGPEAVSRYTLGLLIAARERLDPSGLHPARSADATAQRPRDLRLLTSRADRALRSRARPISEVAAGR